MLFIAIAGLSIVAGFVGGILGAVTVLWVFDYGGIANTEGV